MQFEINATINVMDEPNEPNVPILHQHKVGAWEVRIKELPCGKAELSITYERALRFVRTLSDIDKAYTYAMNILAK